MAPVFVLAIVATAAAGAFVAGQPGRGLPGHPEPGAAARRRVNGVHDPAGGRRVPGRPRVRRRRLAGRDRDGPSRRTAARVVELTRPRDDAAGPRLRHPGLAAAGRDGDHGRRPACRRDRGGGLLRVTDAMTSADVTAAARPDRAAATNGRRRMPSRRPSGRTTRRSSGGWCSSSATRTTPRTSPRTRTCRLPIVGPVRRRPTSAAGSTRSPCAWRSTTAAAAGAGSRRSAGSSRGRGATRPTRTCGRPSRTLEPRTRIALLLNVLDGYTQAEIAAMLGVPEGTVASWISRGRSALRKELGPDR